MGVGNTSFWAGDIAVQDVSYDVFYGGKEHIKIVDIIVLDSNDFENIDTTEVTK